MVSLQPTSSIETVLGQDDTAGVAGMQAFMARSVMPPLRTGGTYDTENACSRGAT